MPNTVDYPTLVKRTGRSAGDLYTRQCTRCNATYFGFLIKKIFEYSKFILN